MYDEEDKRKLFEINKELSELVPEIRLQVFKKRAPRYFEEETITEEGEKAEKVEEIPTEDEEDAFFIKHSNEKTSPSDNVFTICAWFFSQYGSSFAITTKLVKQKAKEKGLTIPTDPDSNLRNKKNKKNGKLLYTSIKGKKGYLLTPFGEAYLKEKFNVIKGTKPLPPELEEK